MRLLLPWMMQSHPGHNFIDMIFRKNIHLRFFLKSAQSKTNLMHSFRWSDCPTAIKDFGNSVCSAYNTISWNVAARLNHVLPGEKE